MFETYLTVVGTVISDIVERSLPRGERVCRFRLVSQERRFDKQAQQWTDGDRVFIQVTCWRKLAEGVSASLAKGDQVVVTGRLHLNEYDVNGEARSMMELDARAVGPNLATCTAAVQRPKQVQAMESAMSDREITASTVAA